MGETSTAEEFNKAANKARKKRQKCAFNCTNSRRCANVLDSSATEMSDVCQRLDRRTPVFASFSVGCVMQIRGGRLTHALSSSSPLC